MAATMKDLAKRTGLGLATISSYFNGGNVREKNRKKSRKLLKNFTMRSMRLPGILRQMQQKPLEW